MANQIDISSSRILVVDDNEVNITVISQMLKQAGYRVMVVLSGEAALRLAEKNVPDLILLDIMMPPGIDGFETIKRLKANPITENIPVIFLSALDDTQTKVKGFDMGAVDFVTKPFQEKEVLARVKSHLTLATLERERNEQIARLEEMNQEKDKMMQIVSHDLRSPLSGIKGMSELLQGEEADIPDLVREFSKHIFNSSTTLINLVNDLLDVAKIESGTLTLSLSEFSLSELLKDCYNALFVLAKQKQINLEFIGWDDNHVITADKPKLFQAFNNLISNAIKFTPQSGTVRVHLQSRGEQYVVEISDSGIGIPDEMIPRLFEKFGNHQRPGTSGEKGTGLGMSIIKKFVEGHRGNISVQSIVNEGTTFVVVLPTIAKQETANAEAIA
jgi:two-component system, sensor histidine kinase and response regulator